MYTIHDEILAFNDRNVEEVSADIGVLVIDNNNKRKFVLGLLDSGARSVYIKKKALTGIPRQEKI